MSGHPWQFYAKVGSLCFVVGGCMELFMIKTGFYDKVTELEAARLEQTREQREQFYRGLRAEVERQARDRNVALRLPDHNQSR